MSTFNEVIYRTKKSKNIPEIERKHFSRRAILINIHVENVRIALPWQFLPATTYFHFL